MSASLDLQTGIASLLALPGLLPNAGIPVQARRPKDVASELDTTAALMHGLAVFVQPGLLAECVTEGVLTPAVRYECAIEIVEIPRMNAFAAPADIYNTSEAVALGLHWQPTRRIQELIAALMAANENMTEPEALTALQADPAHAQLFALARMLAHPLYLSRRITETQEGRFTDDHPAFSGKIVRTAVINLKAVLQLTTNPPA